MNVNGPDPETQRLIAKVLTLHFQEGLLQAAIAESMKLSTAKVNRLIKQGRELGMVEFIIHSPFQRLFEIERQMKEKWPLQECLVVDAVTGNAAITLDLVGKAAADHLRDLMFEDAIVAISGGKALSAVADNLNVAEPVNSQVVPLTGGVKGQHYTDVNHIATRLADALGGSANLIHAPLHADTRDERDMLMSVRSVREVMECARGANIALFGIGSVADEDSTYFAAHPLSEEDRVGLYEDGVRAEFLGNLIDGNGNLCDNELNSRLVSLPLDQAKNIPTRIGIASGSDKIEPICAALNGGHINILVIDDKTAEDALAHELAAG